MIVLTSAYLLIIAGVFASPVSEEQLTVSINAPECMQEHDTLVCDYGNTSQVTVYFQDTQDAVVKSVVLYNIKHLFLSDDAFENITLFNINNITIIPALRETCDNKFCESEYGSKITHLTISSSSLHRLPERVTYLNLDQCKIDLLSSLSYTNSLTITGSIIQKINVTETVIPGTVVTIRNTSVITLQSLFIGPEGNTIFENSTIDVISEGAVVVNNGTLTIQQSSVYSVSNNSIYMMPMAYVQLVQFSGDLNLKTECYSANINSTIESLEIKCEPDKAYFIAYISFLVLFIIMTVLFLFAMGMKKKKDSQREKNPNSDLEHERRVYSIKGNKKLNQPLLKDTADEAHEVSNLIDTFEDDIMKSLDVSKALYFEDLEDIKLDMKTAIDARKKLAFDDFISENSKRLELQQFQVKTKSKIDKNTAMLERMNQAVRDLIEEQYVNNTFNITSAGDDIKLNHKEKIVECNKRFTDDLREILKTAIDNWDHDLKGDKKLCPHLVQYLRNMLSQLHKSMNQLQAQMERNAIRSMDKYRETIAKLEQTHTSYLKNIKASAEQKLELVRSIEKDDAEIFGSKKASQLASIQEHTVNISESLQQKQAERESSEVRQNLLHQEEVIKYQEEYISHLERITHVLTDIRSCYFQFPKEQAEDRISPKEDNPKLSKLTGRPGAPRANSRNSEDLCLTIFKDETE